jgi:Zn-finger nucleic acid-binding protein
MFRWPHRESGRRGEVDVNCPNCGAAMRLENSKEYFQCDYCRTTHFPEPNADGVRVLGVPGGAACPVCHRELVHAAISHQRLLYCERCRGILVPMETFVALVDHLRADPERQKTPALPVDPSDLKREVECPLCHERMYTHPYAGPGNVIIDNCPSCSVNWLDHAEIRRIVSAPG